MPEQSKCAKRFVTPTYKLPIQNERIRETGRKTYTRVLISISFQQYFEDIMQTTFVILIFSFVSRNLSM